MALEALSSNELLNFIIHDTISATPYSSHDSVSSTMISMDHALNSSSLGTQQHCHSTKPEKAVNRRQNLAVQGKKKRRRKPRICKNKDEAEKQRMTHIAAERNRRKQMNEHLAVLRSLMPESYIQRGDQASIVGGAISFLKELEYLLQSLEAQKLQLMREVSEAAAAGCEDISTAASRILQPPFSQFFSHPQYTWSQFPSKYTSKTKGAVADIEVTLIETHANLRILTRKSPRQVSKLVAGFQSLYFSILHLNVTIVEPFVLYTISAKVEEGCQLISVDEIAGAVHHMLRIIWEEPALC